MRFIHRLGYYLGGFAIGLIILAFFLSGKKTSCSYFPEDRVLKQLRLKPHTIANEAQSTYKKLNLDSMAIASVLTNGNVNFRESEPRQKPCSIYSISGETQKGQLVKLKITNCEEETTITAIESL